MFSDPTPRRYPLRVWRIETSRLVIRPYRPDDAVVVKAAIDASLEHLRPWMPWAAHEPESIESKRERLALFAQQFITGEDNVLGVFNREESALFGSTGLHPRVGCGAVEIGYWVHVDHIGQGIAREVVHALCQAAFAHENLRRIEVHCDPRNEASAAVPRKCGFVLQTVIENCVKTAGAEPRDTMIWTMTRQTFDSTESQRQVEAHFFDAAGHRR